MQLNGQLQRVNLEKEALTAELDRVRGQLAEANARTTERTSVALEVRE